MRPSWMVVSTSTRRRGLRKRQRAWASPRDWAPCVPSLTGAGVPAARGVFRVPYQATTCRTCITILALAYTIAYCPCAPGPTDPAPRGLLTTCSSCRAVQGAADHRHDIVGQY